jgi:5-methylcytosine-specific restriction endonuclease McrA
MAYPANGRIYCGNPCRYAHKRGERAPNAGGGDWMRGPGNPNWRGGISTDRDRARVGRWRREVFERDGYACQGCGDDRGNNLRAHHIAPWFAYPESRFDVDNGVTLCHDCHTQLHAEYGYMHDGCVKPIWDGDGIPLLVY